MPIKYQSKSSKRLVHKRVSPIVSDKNLIRSSWFLTSLVLFLITLATGVAIGTFFFNFISKGVDAKVERTVNLSADTCAIGIEPKQVVNVVATAYSSSPAQTDSTPCITATGYDVCENYALYGSANTVASNFLPLHSVIKIPELYGDRIFVVRDRMNPRYGKYNLDIWMPTYSDARRFGSKQITVEVY